MTDLRQSLDRNNFYFVLDEMIAGAIVDDGKTYGGISRDKRTPGCNNLYDTIKAQYQILKSAEQTRYDINNWISAYNTIKNAFDEYIKNEPPAKIKVNVAQRSINDLVRPYSCDKSRDLNETDFEETFYRSVLLLICLLFMRKYGISEQHFFSKTTGLLMVSVSLLNHLIKKKDEQGYLCGTMYTQLLQVYKLVYPQTAGRRKSRKRRAKTRRSKQY